MPNRIDAHLLAELGGDGAVDIGGGGALEHERVGHHGREQQLGLDVGKLNAEHAGELGDDGAAGAPGQADVVQRAGGLEVADAVMIDNAKDRGVLKAGDGLGGLVVVGEDDELTGLDGLDHAGLGDAGVGEQLGGLGILNLVEQLGQDDGAHDGVVIGVLVTKDKNVCHGYPPLDMCTWT